MKSLLVIITLLLIMSCDDDDMPSMGVFENTISKTVTYGGSNFDSFRAVIVTNDGGYAAFGVTESTDFDVDFKQRAGADYLLVKFDSDLNVEWAKNYGGSGDDQAHDLVQTADNGYALIGYSQSADGDGSNNEGFHDNWIIKVDVNGNIEWEKSYGFSGHDHAYDILYLDDGYAIGGFLDVTASEGEGSTRQGVRRHGVGEFWVHRLNEDGSIRWRKYFGGTHDERVHGMTKAENGSIILAGYTESADFDVTNNKGGYDYWAVKVDADGNLLWENTYGGTAFDFGYSITKTTNGNYLMTGSSLSTDINVSSNYGNADIWIVSINEDGDIQWEQNYGGSGFDSGIEITPASNGGIWLAGNSRSGDGDILNNYGENDGILLHLDSNGGIEDVLNIGGSDFDFLMDVKEVNETKIVVVGETSSSDIDFNQNRGSADAFISIVE